MSVNLEQFRRSLKREQAKLVDAAVRDTQIAVAQHVYERVILRTPVLTGHARHNWMPSVNTQVEEEQEGVFGGVETGEPITAAERMRWKDTIKALRLLPVGQTLWITNNVPYILKLEFGGYPAGPGTIDGFSRKAPHGMLGITVREILEGVYKSQPKVMGNDGGL